MITIKIKIEQISKNQMNLEVEDLDKDITQDEQYIVDLVHKSLQQVVDFIRQNADKSAVFDNKFIRRESNE